jgi:hypothetical protein
MAMCRQQQLKERLNRNIRKFWQRLDDFDGAFNGSKIKISKMWWLR